MKRLILFTLVFVLGASGIRLYAYNLRKAGNQSITGSVVHSVCQDQRGLIWVGTTIGLSTYDGKNNIIVPGCKDVDKIWETDHEILWEATPQGLRKIERNQRRRNREYI